MGAVLNHWINYSVWICTAAALLSDRRDTRPEWALQWERLGTTRLSLRLWGTQIFYHSGPWTLAENVCLLLPWGRHSSEPGWDCHRGRRRAPCSWDCACVQRSCPGTQEGSWTLQGRGICERMCLHFCCSCRMVLEAWFHLSLRTSVLLSSQHYLPVGLKHLLDFFFKCSDNLKIWWSQMIFKWILNGCQLFNF